MLWQPALSDAEIDDNLARISRVDQAFEEHPSFPWVRAGLQADFHPKRSGAAWTQSKAARSTPTPALRTAPSTTRSTGTERLESVLESDASRVCVPSGDEEPGFATTRLEPLQP
jgi:hypothetical protein